MATIYAISKSTKEAVGVVRTFESFADFKKRFIDRLNESTKALFTYRFEWLEFTGNPDKDRKVLQYDCNFKHVEFDRAMSDVDLSNAKEADYATRSIYDRVLNEDAEILAKLNDRRDMTLAEVEEALGYKISLIS